MSSIVSTQQLQTNVTSIGNGNPFFIGNTANKLMIEIIGENVTSSTIVFEVATSSGIFYPITGYRLSDYATATQTTTVNEIWCFEDITQLTFRARISAISGTNASITINATLLIE